MDEGRLELFQKKIRGRLRNWWEEEHRANKLLEQLVSRGSQETKLRRNK